MDCLLTKKQNPKLNGAYGVQCDGCMTYCDVFAFHNKWPLKVRDEIMSTIAASESMLHKTPASTPHKYLHAVWAVMKYRRY